MVEASENADNNTAEAFLQGGSLKHAPGPYFGGYGGRWMPESLIAALDELEDTFEKAKDHDRPVCFIAYTIKGFGLPANAETWKNLLVVPELHARVTLLNEKNEVVARLGEDVARVTGKDGGKIRGDKSQWQAGRFVHPHDACFAADGSIFVAEWVAEGRVSKLKKLT
jgi:hypothetical protein